MGIRWSRFPIDLDACGSFESRSSTTKRPVNHHDEQWKYAGKQHFLLWIRSLVIDRRLTREFNFSVSKAFRRRTRRKNVSFDNLVCSLPLYCGYNDSCLDLSFSFQKKSSNRFSCSSVEWSLSATRYVAFCLLVLITNGTAPVYSYSSRSRLFNDLRQIWHVWTKSNAWQVE